MIDPEAARATLREYYRTTPPEQIIADLRRYSPELARRLGVDVDPVPQKRTGLRAVRGALAGFRRSVLRILS